MQKLLTSQVFLGAALLAVTFCGGATAQAQEPRSPAKEYLPLIEGRNDQENGQPQATDLRPDDRPLTGVQETTLGTQEMRHSYWLPGFQYANLARSSPVNQPAVTNWNSTSYLTGNLSVLDAWSHAQLSMNYSGGGALSTDTSFGNSYFHQFGLTQTFDWQRFKLQFIDQFSYLPETQFGFGGLTNLALPGVGGPITPPATGLQNNFTPNQSILASVGPRYSNSLVAQVVYELSRRASITAAGSYGLLRFVDPGNINSDDVIGNLGFNYELTRIDTLGVLYRFSGYQFSGNPQRINDHAINLAYGRKVTGRLALRLFGGPDFITFRVPILNSSGRLSASGGAALTYLTARSGFFLNYNHGVSNGSGVLVGSTTDQISGTLTRHLGQVWSANINFGYARNNSIFQTTTQKLPNFDSYFAGGGLDRPLGRNAIFSLSYTAYIQGTAQQVCSPGSCIGTTTVHQIAMGFVWHTRPYVIR